MVSRLSKILILIIILIIQGNLYAQDIPKLQRQLDKGNYEKCIKKAYRYKKYKKKDVHVYYFLSYANLRLINKNDNDKYKIRQFNKSCNELIKYRNHLKRKKLSGHPNLEELTHEIDSFFHVFTKVIINDSMGFDALKRLNVKYKKIYGANLDEYEVLLNNVITNHKVDSLGIINQTPSEYIPININRDHLIEIAKSLEGTPYKRAGETVNGFDCSGFVMYVYDKMNIKLPHNAHSISKLEIEISMNNIKSGDLLCFGSRDRIYHIGIFYKKDNQPSVIHCISSGVKIDEDIQWNYWKKRIGKIVRVCSN